MERNVLCRYAYIFLGGNLVSVEENQRKYNVKIGTTVFAVEVAETDSARETAYQKIKRLIDNDCDRVILDEKRKLANNNTIV